MWMHAKSMVHIILEEGYVSSGDLEAAAVKWGQPTDERHQKPPIWAFPTHRIVDSNGKVLEPGHASELLKRSVRHSYDIMACEYRRTDECLVGFTTPLW